MNVRIPKEWLPRADALAKRLSVIGWQMNRSQAIRRAIAIGFEALEKGEVR